MKIDMKEVLKPASILFAICLLVTALLVGTNMLTANMIAQNAVEKEAATRLVVLPSATEFEEEENCVVGYANGEIVGYVYTTDGVGGYGGVVQVMTGIAADGTITGVAILSHAETPGLGANCEKEDFRNQYCQTAPEGGFIVVKNQEASAGQVEAMTGATITTRAVTNAVNEAVALFHAR